MPYNRGNYRDKWRIERLATGLLLGAAATSLGACNSSPAVFGITGPSPDQSLFPPGPTASETNPDATAVIPGVRTGSDAYAPSVLMAPAVPGKFFGAD